MGKSSSILIGERGGNHVLIEPEPKVTARRPCGLHRDSLRRIQRTLRRAVPRGRIGEVWQDVGYLCEDLKCTAALHAEDLLELMLTGDTHGRVHISGSARETPQTKTRPEFEFDLDLVELRTASHALIAADRQ